MTISVPRPAEVEQFLELATQLYRIEECSTGGPLHVELEDHNTEFLVGEQALRKIERFTAALEMIEAGNVPAAPAAPPKWGEGWTDAALIHDDAHYWGDHPEALRTSLAILEITKGWTEDQAAAAYGTWSERCTCKPYPAFEER